MQLGNYYLYQHHRPGYRRNENYKIAANVVAIVFVACTRRVYQAYNL